MTTTAHGLHYPTAADAPNGAGQIQQLATDIESILLAGGKSIVATSETRTSSSYGLLTTPDRVQSVVLPTDGIIQVRFLAQWNQSTSVAASAAIFLGSNQLQATTDIGAADPSVATVGTGSSNGVDHWLSTYWQGLVSVAGASGASPSGPSSTGQVLGTFLAGAGGGGAVDIVAPGGTYDVSVQFKTAGGTLTVRNRKLWVRVLPF